jgi:hypothetical protein
MQCPRSARFKQGDDRLVLHHAGILEGDSIVNQQQTNGLSTSADVEVGKLEVVA